MMAGTMDPAHNYRILLAEDDEICRQLVAVLLSEIGAVDLVAAGDGRKALEAAVTDAYDLLIIDQNLPRITGDRLIRQIRNVRGPNFDTPILRYSAHFDTATRQEVAGRVEARLPKPFTGALFVETVRDLLVTATAGPVPIKDIPCKAQH